MCVMVLDFFAKIRIYFTVRMVLPCGINSGHVTVSPFGHIFSCLPNRKNGAWGRKLVFITAHVDDAGDLVDTRKAVEIKTVYCPELIRSCINAGRIAVQPKITSGHVYERRFIRDISVSCYLVVLRWRCAGISH